MAFLMASRKLDCISRYEICFKANFWKQYRIWLDVLSTAILLSIMSQLDEKPPGHQLLEYPALGIASMAIIRTGLGLKRIIGMIIQYLLPRLICGWYSLEGGAAIMSIIGNNKNQKNVSVD